ncbi:MAG TPA: hypothetical protein VGA77_04150 [Propylenella sp.]
MNTFTREHYPASKLPEELREGIDPNRQVTVTVVEEEASPERVMTLEEILAAAAPYRRRSAEQIDAQIRAERDAWGD